MRCGGTILQKIHHPENIKQRQRSKKHHVRFVDEELDGEARVEALFPTQQRLRDKQRKKDGFQSKRKPQQVEQHFDDCGEDFTPLMYLDRTPEDHTDDFGRYAELAEHAYFDEQPYKMLSERFGFAGSGCYFENLSNM